MIHNGTPEPGAAGVPDPAQRGVRHCGKKRWMGELYPEESLYGGPFGLSAGGV